MTIIWHNPRCSKSRQALALLQERGITPEIVLYLETPPDAAEIKAILAKLATPARDLLRKGEEEYKKLGLADATLDEGAIVAAMAAHPKLIERPIVIQGKQAVVARPPEKLLDIL